MNSEQIKKLLPIIVAFAEGKTLQYKSAVTPERGWVEYDPLKHTTWGLFAHNPNYYDWRIKPEKKTGWIAIHKDGLRVTGVCTSAFSAISQFGAIHTAACLPIEYEEGQNL